MFYSVFATFLLPCSSSSLERALELTPGYPFPGALTNLTNRVRRVLPKHLLPYYPLFFSYSLTTYSVMDIKTCEKCAYIRLMSFFTNKSGIKAVAKCSVYRDQIITVTKRRKLAIRIPLGNLDLNKRRPPPKSPYRPAVRLSSRSPRRSSFLKRRRNLGLALEEQGLLKRTFRRRDENITYKDFSLSSGFLPFIVALLP